MELQIKVFSVVRYNGINLFYVTSFSFERSLVSKLLYIIVKDSTTDQISSDQIQ